jgi:hypothetical protein
VRAIESRFDCVPFAGATEREGIMFRKKSIVAFEAEVIQVIEGELGRKLPWLDEFDESSFGLVVEDQHVRRLAVPESGLERLPDNIGLLSKLEILNLKGCRLERLPESIGDLGCLRTLGLRSNCLTSLPDSLGKLRELRVLSVSENQLVRLPDSIGNLVNLRELVLHKNNLTSLPATVGGLVNLQLLVLTENKLESIPDGLGSMPHLKECYLAGNRLTRLPGSIARLTALRRLVLDGNPLDEASLQLARTLASSGCVVEMRADNAIQARMAELAADPEAFAENATGEDLVTAMKAIFIDLVPYFEGVEATYEEDYCVSAVKLSNVRATEAGIQAVVTFLSGYEDPGKQWDFSCRWDGIIYTASKWFIVNIGTFTFDNSRMRHRRDEPAIGPGQDDCAGREADGRPVLGHGGNGVHEGGPVRRGGEGIEEVARIGSDLSAGLGAPGHFLQQPGPKGRGSGRRGKGAAVCPGRLAGHRDHARVPEAVDGVIGRKRLALYPEHPWPPYCERSHLPLPGGTVRVTSEHLIGLPCGGTIPSRHTRNGRFACNRLPARESYQSTSARYVETT